MKYITDQQMINLGFEKRKSYQKKETGVSSYCWMLDNGFMLNIVRDEYDDDIWIPSFKLQKFVYTFTDVNELKAMLQSLGLINKDIIDIKQNQLAEIIFLDGQPIRAISNYLIETMDLLNKYECVLNKVNYKDGIITEEYIEMDDNQFVNALSYFIYRFKENN